MPSAVADIVGLRLFVLVFVFGASLILSETIRGYIAYLLGDKYGYVEKRFFSNPLEYINFYGTILLPLFSFICQIPFIMGYCDYSLIDYERIKLEKFGASLVILSKPIAEFILCTCSLILMRWSKPLSLAYDVFSVGAELNAVLIVFSLLPILPLSGGQLIALNLPRKWQEYYLKHEPYTLFIMIGAILILPMLGIPFFQTVIIEGAQQVVDASLAIIGFLI